jgi:hypothetical protein
MNMTLTTTLHQLCHAPALWANCLDQLGALWQPDDAIILLGPAAQGVFDHRLDAFSNRYVLQADLNVLGIPSQQIQYKVLDYNDWAQLVLRHQRHLTWK